VKSWISLAFAQRRSFALLSALRSVIACSQWDGGGKEAEATERRPSVKKTGFIPRLESLRGVAALTVVGYHVYNQLSDGPVNGWFDTLVTRLIGACANGTGAVVTFFVLSG